MTFEDDFPSLKGKWDKTNGSTSFYYEVETIKRYCLDKQKVKDIILTTLPTRYAKLLLKKLEL